MFAFADKADCVSRRSRAGVIPNSKVTKLKQLCLLLITIIYQLTQQIFIVFLVCSRHDSKYCVMEMNKTNKSPVPMVSIA